MLFLVKGIVEITQYQADTTKEETLRLVDAESTGEAMDKFINHYEGMTDQYSRYYSVYTVEATPVIS